MCPDFNLQFNQFVVRDEQPLLFETGMKQMFPLVHDAVARVIDPASLRYHQFQPLRAGRVWFD
jgi:flavorubredoxin